MTQTDSFDQKFQKRISAITCGVQVAGMSAHSLKVLTNDFEEKYVQQLIGKSDAPADQLTILEAIRKAFDDIHLDGFEYGMPNYDREIPSYFEQFHLDLELGMPITDADVDIPTSASDPKFEELCKSLTDQRTKFEQVTVAMHSFMGQVEKGDPTYKRISVLLKDYEAKCKECDELRDKNKELTVQLDEAQKMNKKLAEKSDDKVVERIIRQYLYQSKKKSTSKKEHIKTIIDEMVKSANVELSDDLKSMLDTFDNETPAHIDKAEIYENGSTKNENCKQVIAAPFPTEQSLPIDNKKTSPLPWEDVDDFPF